MATGEVKTQGTHLYFVNPTGPALVKLTCPTGITGLGGGDVDQIEDTCLDETDQHTFMDGLRAPESITVPFNLIPRDASHQLLFALRDQKPRPVLKWMALLSESATPPTLSGGAMTPPNDRFDCVITGVSIDIATNEIVRGTLTIQVRSLVVPQWFVPA
jgi:hypothetical protein